MRKSKSYVSNDPEVDTRAIRNGGEYRDDYGIIRVELLGDSKIENMITKSGVEWELGDIGNYLWGRGMAEMGFDTKVIKDLKTTGDRKRINDYVSLVRDYMVGKAAGPSTLGTLMDIKDSPVIYERITGSRLEQHIASGKLLPGTSVRTTKVLGGKTAREIAEQLRINSLGGIKYLENIRNPIGPARQYLIPKIP